MEQPRKQRTGLRARGPGQLVAWIFSSALLVAALGLLGKRILHPPVGPECNLPNPPKYPHTETHAALFQEAKNHIRANEWLEARANLLEIERSAPDYPGLKDYLERAEKEIPNEQHLDAARGQLVEGHFAAAKAQLDQIGTDTTMFEEVSKLRRALQESLDMHLRNAQSQFDAGQFNQAQSLLDEVLAVTPDQPQAHALADRLKHQGEGEPELPPEATRLAALAERVSQQFVAGDLPGAIALAEACSPLEGKCRSLLKNLKQFKRLMESPRQLTTEQLSTLIDIEDRIAGPKNPSKVFKSEDPAMMFRLYDGAVAARSEGKWARALEFAQHVLLTNPKSAGAKRIIRELRNRANELYFKTMHPSGDTNPEDAIRMYREIMDLTLPDDELHQKAKSWLEKIEK